MTPDGITAEDWDVVHELALAVTNATLTDDKASQESSLKELKNALDDLERKYGPLPSILATRADYVESTFDAVALLERAYGLSEGAKDFRNMTYIASSLAELYIEELSEFTEGRSWLERLSSCLERFNDDDERETYQRLWTLLP